MSKVVVAKTLKGNDPVRLDIGRLPYTRMFVQASSGGGKTNAVRIICEKTHGKVQHIVLDWEGEYANLREKYDYILAGRDGDVPADPRSAEILARRILELGSSLIVDLYSLPIQKRLEYVKLFCRALVNSPKELYTHPVLVVIDEIQHYIPEKERKGDAEVAQAVIDLITQGRKRGIGVLGVSQRISKVDKDGVAEFLNKAIGLCGLDNDRKRAGEELGFTTKEEIRSLRDLDQGVFYVFGPALSKDVVLAKFPLAETDPPPLGHGVMKVPPPSEQVLKQLAKLTDLPAEAERELKSKEDMLKAIHDLKRENRELKHSAPKPKLDEAALKRAQDAYYQRGFKEASFQASDSIRKLRTALSTAVMKLNRVSDVLGGTKIDIPEIRFEAHLPERTIPPALSTLTARVAPINTPPINVEPVESEGVRYGKCERMILRFLSLDSNVDRSFTKSQIGAVTHYSSTSGGFNNSISLLRKQNLIRGTDPISINPDELDRAREICKDVELGTLNDWLHNLGRAEREIFKKLKDEPERIFTKEEIAQETNYSATSGGFNNAISHLGTLGLAEKADGGIRFNSKLMEVVEA